MASSQTNIFPKRAFLTFFNILTLILAISQAFIFLSRGLEPTSAPEFTSSLFLFIKHVALIIFSLIVLRPLFPKPAAPPKKVIAKPWRPFFLFLASITLFNILIDPSGQANISLIPALDNTSRISKSEYYSILPETPNLVILGTSRTFAISPDYIYETLGYKAFNFGNANQSLDELLIQLRFIDAQSSRFPEILFAETLPTLVSNKQNAAEQAPFAMLPYMDFETAGYFLIFKTSEYLSIHTLTESIYSLQFSIQNPNNLSKWTFQPDGSGIRNFPPPTPEKFGRLIHSTDIFPTCSTYSSESIELFREAIQFAYDRNTAIIIYSSPWQPDFFAGFLQTNPGYLRCQQLFLDLITSLQQSYPNLFFLDFTHVESFNGLPGQDGFYDSHHLTYQNSNLLIDAAAATIHQAYQYAHNAREESP